MQNNLALFVLNIVFDSVHKVIRVKFDEKFILFYVYGLDRIKKLDNVLLFVAKSAKKHSDRHFAAFVDTHIKHIFGIILKIKPRASIRDNLRCINKLVRRSGAFFFFENHPGASVELIDYNALNAVDDERNSIRHQGNFAYKNFLFFYVFDAYFLATFVVLFVQGKANFHL